MSPLLIIALLSIPIVWISFRALLDPRSHGFPRFFAFEAILVLIVLNWPAWFTRPLALHQILSWLVLAMSLVCLIWGLALLRSLGRSRPAEPESTLYEWENTTRLVTEGIYRYIRHPMYASLFYLAWGATLKSISALTVALAAVATVALFFTAMAEEKENVLRFGEEYRAYMTRSRRFIPFVF